MLDDDEIKVLADPNGYETLPDDPDVQARLVARGMMRWDSKRDCYVVTGKGTWELALAAAVKR